MRFKQWLRLDESGHILMDSPENLTVLYKGKVVTVPGVDMIDPKFEFSNYPPPPKANNKEGKFLGEVDFALPLAAANGQPQMYLNSKRRASLTGNGAVGPTAQGYVIPDQHWADKAEFVGGDGRAINLDTLIQNGM